MQSPDGQSEAPIEEQVPAQLAPRPQVASSTVLSKRQQLTVTASLRKVNTLSKKSIVLVFVFPEVNHQNHLSPQVNLDWWCFGKMVGKETPWF